MQPRRPVITRPSLPLGVVLLTAATLSAHARPADYAIDPVHTRVAFLVEHAGFSRALGTFSDSRGRLHFDPDDWRSAQLEVIVPLRCLELGDAKWEKATLGERLLDAEDHPEARFVSTRVEPTGQNTAKVVGELTLRGITREVTLDVKLNALKRNPLNFRRTAGFSATTTLDRRDFGMTAWENVIGDRVELIIEAEATRTGRATGSDDEGDEDGT